MKRFALLTWVPIFVAVFLTKQGYGQAAAILWISGVLLQFFVGVTYLYKRFRS